ncbi:MAG: recombinase RecT [Pseudomonadota bacterium]
MAEAKSRTSELAIARTTGGMTPVFQHVGQMMEYAHLMSKAGAMVRPAFQNNPGACLGIIETAMAFSMRPFALAQKAYLVGDTVAYEAQAVTGMIYATGKIEQRFQYDYEGEGETRRVTVTAKVKGAARAEKITTPPKREIKPQNSPLWKSDPDQQLAYYGARAWCRRHAPDLLLGVYDVDEMHGVVIEGGAINVTPKDDPAARLTQRLDAAASESAPHPIDDPDVIDAEVEDVTAGDASTLPDEAETQAAPGVAVEESAPADTGGLPFDDVPATQPEAEAVAEVTAPTLVAFTELDDRDAVLKACEAYTKNWIAARGQITSRSGPQMDAFIEATTADCQRVRDVSADLYAKIVEAM